MLVYSLPETGRKPVWTVWLAELAMWWFTRLLALCLCLSAEMVAYRTWIKYNAMKTTTTTTKPEN